ncbi:MAG: 1,2-phenylacetyl-CoA epoxidase subunit PaaB [Dermatophilaceae bacterium]
MSAPEVNTPADSTSEANSPADSTSEANTLAVKGNTTERSWPLWEVFVRGKRGLSHVHAGSLHAPDAEMALRNARDLYTRRQEGVSLWVVKSTDITANSPDERGSFFDPAADKVYRHPTFYDVPEDVEYL